MERTVLRTASTAHESPAAPRPATRRAARPVRQLRGVRRCNEDVAERDRTRGARPFRRPRWWSAGRCRSPRRPDPGTPELSHHDTAVTDPVTRSREGTTTTPPASPDTPTTPRDDAQPGVEFHPGRSTSSPNATPTATRTAFLLCCRPTAEPTRPAPTPAPTTHTTTIAGWAEAGGAVGRHGAGRACTGGGPVPGGPLVVFVRRLSDVRQAPAVVIASSDSASTWPPSTISPWPVMNPACSEARNNAAWPISSLVASLPIGMDRAMSRT